MKPINHRRMRREPRRPIEANKSCRTAYLTTVINKALEETKISSKFDKHLYLSS